MSHRLEWLFEADDDSSMPMSGDRPRGGLVDGRYELVERLGAGALGVVYRAEDIWLGRRVAIKVIGPNGAPGAGDSDLLRQEARARAKVCHRNVAQVYALGPHAGSFYIAMEYVAGASLGAIIDEHIANGTRMDLSRALEIVGAIERGLRALHANGLVHRDVKPSNVLLEEGTGRPVLVDFGFASSADVDDDPAADLDALASTAVALLSITATPSALDASRTALPAASRPHAPAKRALRVIVLQSDDALRRQIVRLVDRTLRAKGEHVEIEHVASAAELGAACQREVPHLVVLDEETTNGRAAGIVRALGEKVGADGPPEVLLLRRSFDAPSFENAPCHVVELPKPVDAQVLASVLSKMGMNLALRRQITPPSMPA